ncbi:hypothetical protein [Streptomyces venezuelae]|uniref:hypothetical protein n=1 Tax=Streptomyces venezuelae TaxID=54571 RepID=UPI0037AEA850
MTDTTGADTTTRGSLLRRTPPPLPGEPGPASAWPDRESLLRAQSEALKTVMREDLSRRRAWAFVTCAAVTTLVTALIPVLIADAVTHADADTPEAASAAVGCLVLTLVAVPPLLVLRSLRARAKERSRLLRQWAAVDRGHDSSIPPGYGSQGAPHSRFAHAAVVLLLASVLAVAVLANPDEPDAMALLPGLAVAAAFAWATVRKYTDRYGWASRENVIRGRERRRYRHRELGTATDEAQRGGIHPAFLYVALCAPVTIVTAVFALLRPEQVIGLVLVGAIALVVLVIGLPWVVLKRRRERAELGRAALALAGSVPPGAVAHAVLYGLGAPMGRAAVGPGCWDGGPPRAGVLAIGAGALHLRGMDGASLDLPFSKIAGAAYIASTVSWLDPSIDLFLTSGESVEVRTARAKEIADALSDVLTPSPPPTSAPQ